MNSYEISAKLDTFGFEGNNGNETLSIMRLMRACELFVIEFDWELAVKGNLFGHVGHYEYEPGKEVWFIVRDLEERQDCPGDIKYTLIHHNQEVTRIIE